MREWAVWTSELSPFGLKLLLLCGGSGLEVRVLPGSGSTRENIGYARRRRLLLRRRLPLTWPRMTAEDEFPAVPYLFGPNGENLYDSTAIAEWLDDRASAEALRWIPDDPAQAFVVRLIDDYADEFCLYMVHHNRWKVSATDNDAGARLAREFASLFGPARHAFGRWFARRQVRRLPYLFSVAPEGFRIDGLAAALTPPSRAGFPPTHELLEEAFTRLLDILEALLGKRAFVLGERPTLADAALYGQLAMNLSDPSARHWIRERAPRLEAWLQRLHGGCELPPHGALGLDNAVKPLLREIFRTHCALMRANHRAWADESRRGLTRFNEPAFERNEALYDGVMEGKAFRSVAKSFQARVWLDCLARWRALGADERKAVARLLPEDHGLDGDAD
jgi:glutathione S-transferase